MGMKGIAVPVVAAGAWAMAAAAPGQTAILDDERASSAFRCGSDRGAAGFAATDDAGDWTGFDAAHCRALAAAVFGGANAMSFVNPTGKTRFPALAPGEVDILSRITTWTLSRDVDR